MMKPLIFVVIALACMPQDDRKLAAPIGDLSGYYSVVGVEAGGKKYSGVCMIERKAEVFVAQWSIGGNTFVGVGVAVGDQLAIGWAAPKDGGIVRGVNMYRVNGKKLVGRWASIPGNGQVQSETLTWLKELEVE